MQRMLECRIDVTYRAVSADYGMIVSCWDGPHLVSSKTYVLQDPVVLLRLARDFVLYWSRLYFDAPDLTPVGDHEFGWKQMHLGI